MRCHSLWSVLVTTSLATMACSKSETQKSQTPAETPEVPTSSSQTPNLEVTPAPTPSYTEAGSLLQQCQMLVSKTERTADEHSALWTIASTVGKAKWNECWDKKIKASDEVADTIQCELTTPAFDATLCAEAVPVFETLTHADLSAPQTAVSEEWEKNPMPNVHPLRFAPKLTKLSVKNYDHADPTAVVDLSSLKALASLPELHTVELMFQHIDKADDSGSRIHKLQLSHLEAFNELPHVKTLDVARFQLSAEETAHLKTLAPRLQKLTLSEGVVPHFEFVSHLTSATSLTLDSVGFSDTAALSSLAKLEELDLSSGAHSDLSPLSNLGQLKILTLAGNCRKSSGEATDPCETRLGDETKSYLPASLRYLDLNFSNVKTLGNLSGLPELEILLLDITPITSLEPVQDTKKLRVLSVDLTGLQAEDFQVLKKIAPLEYLGAWQMGLSRDVCNDLGLNPDFVCNVDWNGKPIIYPIHLK